MQAFIEGGQAASPGELAQQAAQAVGTSRSPGIQAELWLEARHFFSRAADSCWLWLLDSAGRVHALRMDAARFGEARLGAKLRHRLSQADSVPADLAGGAVTVLDAAPVVPLPRWVVSWGHPVQHAIRAFASRLDQEVLDLLGWLEAPGHFVGSVGNYNRLAALPEPLRTHRMQALRRFPALVPRLLLDLGGHPNMFARSDAPDAVSAGTAGEVLDAIDRGRDLIGALAAHFRISRALVRSPLMQRPWRAGYVPGEVLALLDAMPPQARPQHPAEVEDRLVCLNALPVPRGGTKDAVRQAPVFAKGWNRTWGEVAERVPTHPELAVRDTRDFLRAALATAGLDAAGPGLDESTLGLAWLRRRGLISLLDASLRWHAQAVADQYRQATTPRKAEQLPDAVAPLLGTCVIAPLGRAEERASQLELEEEGWAMQHCVGSYWRYCACDAARIFHLETADGATATAMYCVEEGADAPRYVLDQLRGPANAAPGDAMRALAARIETTLNDEGLAARRREVVAAAQAERARWAAWSAAPVARPARELDRRARQDLRLVLDWHGRERAEAQRFATLYCGAIAGFGHGEGLHLLPRLAAGDPLQLVREPANPHDPRAVRIDWNGRKLGYVPRAQNTAIAARLDAGEALVATITRITAGHDRWNAVQIGIDPALLQVMTA